MQKRDVKRNMGLLVIISMVIVFGLLDSENGFMTKTENRFFGQQTGYASDIENLTHISREPSVLYLDAGVAPYYFMANSTSRYICPLPLQRSSPDWNLRGKPQVEQTYRDALAYNGTYIVGDGAFGYHDWLHLEYPDRAELARKLNTEYEIIWTKGWTIYKKK